MSDGPTLLQGDARALPLPDESVDLVVTSPPYFGLRDYGTEGQIGAEATPREFIDALIACTREMVRVLKPSGSIFVNLGDKYSTYESRPGRAATHEWAQKSQQATRYTRNAPEAYGTPYKGLLYLPERYRIACNDELGLIGRAVLVWSKPNGLPESVTDRVRRSHEDWVHLVKSQRYYSAVDEIREPHARHWGGSPNGGHTYQAMKAAGEKDANLATCTPNALGKLPGSVWTVATQPLNVPAELDTDHFAAFPMEWPRRLISGWCPREVCTTCGEGRRPQVLREIGADAQGRVGTRHGGDSARLAHATERKMLDGLSTRTITGYICACSDVTAPATPGVVLDPFGGTGTTALVAHMLDRRGISVDLSTDYQRIARWRCSDPKERARAAGLAPDAVARVVKPGDGQTDLFDALDEEPA